MQFHKLARVVLVYAGLAVSKLLRDLLAAKKLAETGEYDAVICLGAVIRGETDHYDHVAGSVTSGVAQVSLSTGVPTIFGVLSTDTVEQALNRSGLKSGNNGHHAAVAAIEMATLARKIGRG